MNTKRLSILLLIAVLATAVYLGLFTRSQAQGNLNVQPQPPVANVNRPPIIRGRTRCRLNCNINRDECLRRARKNKTAQRRCYATHSGCLKRCG